MSCRVILHHRNCYDGLGAAWAARQHPDWRGTTCIPVSYGDPHPPPLPAGWRILIVDFSYPRDVLLRMHGEVASLHVYDHHKSAEEDLRGLDFCTFDMNRSGAGIVWDEMIGGPRPLAIDYIEDLDLRRHALPHAAEVQAWTRCFPASYKTIEMLVADLPDESTGTVRRGIVEIGALVLRLRRLLIEEAARGAQEVLLYGARGAMVNFGVNGVYTEVAEAVGVDHDFGLAYSFRPDGRVYLSFRSTGDYDVSGLARRFGGGGHHHAAAAQVPWQDWLLVLRENAPTGEDP